MAPDSTVNSDENPVETTNETIAKTNTIEEIQKVNNGNSGVDNDNVLNNEKIERLEDEEIKRLADENIERLEDQEIKKLTDENVEKLEHQEIKKLTDEKIEKLEDAHVEKIANVPANCFASEQLLVGGKLCKTFNDDCFCKIRSKFNVCNEFATTHLEFDFAKLAKAGGKGGDPMAFTADRKLIIKQLNSGDHENLLKLTKRLVDHFSAEKNSLLAPILAHFQLDGSNKKYFVMLNCLDSESVVDGKWMKLYDLKGCADDKLLMSNGEKVSEVHKRFYNLLLWCQGPCTPQREQRKKYFKGKIEALHHPEIPITISQKNEIIAALEYDTAFLKEHQLMDYSLLVGAGEVAPNVESSEELRAGSNLICGKNLVKLSVIDYLQKWTAGKKVARCIKFLERNRATVPPEVYGDRFLSHFKVFLIPVDGNDAAQQTREVANKEMPMRCFPLISA